MWEIVTDWDDIASAQVDVSTGLLLEFADGFILLVCASEESSGDLVQESSAQLMDIGNQSSASVAESN
jgi:hypothetical protein